MTARQPETRRPVITGTTELIAHIGYPTHAFKAPMIYNPYFERAEPLTFTEGGTYVATDVEFQHNTSHSWNHGLGEIVTALLERGLVIDGLVEHTSVPWEALPGRMVKRDDGEWELSERHERLPLSYTLRASRPRG